MNGSVRGASAMHKMLHFLRNGLLLAIMAGTVSPAVSVSAAGKTGGPSNRKSRLKLLPIVESNFHLPGRLRPTRDQIDRLKQLREQYGPRMNTLAVSLLRYDAQRRQQQRNESIQKLLKRSRSRGGRGRRSRGSGNRNRGSKKSSRGSSNKKPPAQVTEALKKYRQMQADVGKEIASMLTADQKRALEKMRGRRKPKQKKTKKSPQ